MSDHPYIEPEHITQKYLKSYLPLFDAKVMNPGWYGFYEPEHHLCDSIPPFSSNSYHLNQNVAPINFVILNSKTVFIGESALEKSKDLLLFDAKSSNGLKIQKNAFRNCSRLYKIHLPYEIDFIDKTAFYGCYNLSVIEIARGELDGKQIEPEHRNIYVPLEYNVIMIGGYPYIYDAVAPKKNDIYKVRKLSINGGKFQNELICKQKLLCFDNINNYPSLWVFGLGNTEQKADENLKIEIETIKSAVNSLQKTKTFSSEMIGVAIACLKTR